MLPTLGCGYSTKELASLMIICPFGTSPLITIVIVFDAKRDLTFNNTRNWSIPRILTEYEA
jgi:hypothetical protein